MFVFVFRNNNTYSLSTNLNYAVIPTSNSIQQAIVAYGNSFNLIKDLIPSDLSVSADTSSMTLSNADSPTQIITQGSDRITSINKFLVFALVLIGLKFSV